VYTAAVIQMLLGLKQMFRLPLRALQGMAQSESELANGIAGLKVYG
jgi:Transposase DDE domain